MRVRCHWQDHPEGIEILKMGDRPDEGHTLEEMGGLLWAVKWVGGEPLSSVSWKVGYPLVPGVSLRYGGGILIVDFYILVTKSI